MSTTPNNDGGPAFPSSKACDSWQCRKPSEGMSLRDWFAGMVLPEVDRRSHGTPKVIATECYQLADAMLVARKKSTNDDK